MEINFKRVKENVTREAGKYRRRDFEVKSH
jgi:hypothetical protein